MLYFKKEQWFDSKGDVDRSQFFDYDCNGRIRKIRSSSQHYYSEDAFVYGKDGRLVAKISFDQNGFQRWCVQYQYDDRNESSPSVVVRTDDLGRKEMEAEYTYAGGRVTESAVSIRESRTIRKKFKYSSDLLVEISASYGDQEFQVVHSISYDDNGRLKLVENTPHDPSVKTVERIRFAYRTNGTLKGLQPMSRTLPSMGFMVKITWEEGLFENDYSEWFTEMMIYG